MSEITVIGVLAYVSVEFTAGGRALFARRLERMNREERTGRQVRAGEDISWV